MDISDRDVEALIEKYESYAREHGFKLNPNRKLVEVIVRGLLKREKEYGYRYCPCRPILGDLEQDKKIICPCVFNEQELKKQGYCHCRLFVKDE